MKKSTTMKSIAAVASIAMVLQLMAAPFGIAWADETIETAGEQAAAVEAEAAEPELEADAEQAEAGEAEQTTEQGTRMQALDKDETDCLLTAKDGSSIDAADGVYTIDAAGSYTYATSGTDTIRIDGTSATLTLKGSTIEAKGHGHSAIEVVNGAQATIIIDGAVTLVGDVNQAGIQVDGSSSLSVTGSGSLKAIGNGNIDYSSTADGKNAGNSYGAGIGGTASSPNAGAISIDGNGKALTVSAIGGGKGAAGIGSAHSGSASTITISDTILSGVHGGCYGAIVEGDAAYAKNTLEGGAGIGGGAKGGQAGTIKIVNCSGSDIVGGGKAAGIGGGCWATGIDVQISGSDLQVAGGTSGAAIGSGRAFENVALSIDIDSSSIVAEGGILGAGIGTGVNGSNRDLAIATVDITSSTVQAVGGAGAAGIGGGVRAYNVSVNIDGASTVTAYAGANYLAKYTEKYNDAGVGQSGSAAIGRGSWGSVTKFMDNENALNPTLSVSADSTVTALSSGDNWAIAGFTDVSGIDSTILQGRFVRNYDLAGKGYIDRSADEGMGEDWTVCYLDGIASTNLIVRDAETGKAATTLTTPDAGTAFANGYEGTGRVGYYSVAMTLPSAGTYTVNTDSAVRTMDRQGDELIGADAQGYLGGATYWDDAERSGSFACTTGLNSFDKMAFRIEAAPEPAPEPEPVIEPMATDEPVVIEEDTVADEPTPTESVETNGNGAAAAATANGTTPAAPSGSTSARFGTASAPSVPSAPAAAAADNASAPAETTIFGNGNPLAGDGASLGSWSLVDLLCTIAAILMFVVMLAGAFRRNEKTDENDQVVTTYKRRRALRIAGIIPALSAAILFVLTQDLSLPMTLVDSWTIFFAIITLVSIVMAIASKTKAEDAEDDDATAPATA